MRLIITIRQSRVKSGKNYYLFKSVKSIRVKIESYWGGIELWKFFNESSDNAASYDVNESMLNAKENDVRVSYGNNGFLTYQRWSRVLRVILCNLNLLQTLFENPHEFWYDSILKIESCKCYENLCLSCSYI